MNIEELLKRYGLDANSTECDECGNQMPLDRWFVNDLKNRTDRELEGEHFLQIDNGLCLNIDGYYGGFTDQMTGYKTPPANPYWALCHDCCVKLFETFPNCVARLGNRGHHPYDDKDEPCCQWGWTFRYDNDGNIIGTEFGDGSFEPSK